MKFEIDPDLIEYVKQRPLATAREFRNKYDFKASDVTSRTVPQKIKATLKRIRNIAYHYGLKIQITPPRYRKYEGLVRNLQPFKVVGQKASTIQWLQNAADRIRFSDGWYKIFFLYFFDKRKLCPLVLMDLHTFLRFYVRLKEENKL